MIYLSPPTTSMLPHVAKVRLGVILTPDSDRPRLYSLDDFPCWAADNGCYAAGERFDEFRYLFWLLGLRRWAHTCLFATAPDIVGDAEGTWKRSRDWLGALRVLGFKAAFVAQDGFDPWEIQPDLFDVLFIGGTDEFKLGPEGAFAVRWGVCAGKWVHVGRVNSAARYKRFQKLGAHSADGTFIKYGPDKNIPQMLNWVKTGRGGLTRAGPRSFSTAPTSRCARLTSTRSRPARLRKEWAARLSPALGI